MARLRILMVASEMTPFAKTGGLADVLGSLPAALQTAGADVRVLMPEYREVSAAYGTKMEFVGSIADQEQRLIQTAFEHGERMNLSRHTNVVRMAHQLPAPRRCRTSLSR